jgi:hypothetical protein
MATVWLPIRNPALMMHPDTHPPTSSFDRQDDDTRSRWT